MRFMYYCMVLALCASYAHAQDQPFLRIQGVILDANSTLPLPGASVKLKHRSAGISADQQGKFTIRVPDSSGTLLCSYIGFDTREVTYSSHSRDPITIYLSPSPTQLKGVQVSTGYETMAREHATGSFSLVGNKVINRKPTPDIMSRLDGMTTSLFLDKRSDEGIPTFNVRGISTIFANATPLIVLDNFPYDGDIHHINPNDVESVTILKDAAAAAIWGVRAGNGVIVITTKKARYHQKARIEFNSNLTIADKPDLFYLPNMATADYIGVEKQLFENGFYNNDELSLDKRALSPVVELLIKEREGLVSHGEATTQLEQWGQRDVRRDFLEHVYRKSINQQYAISITGKSDQVSYYLSSGYDKQLLNKNGNDNARVSLKSQFVFQPVKPLEIAAGIYSVSSTQDMSNKVGYDDINRSGRYIYPYAQLADETGHPLPVTWDYRDSYLTEKTAQGFLDGQYNPIRNQQTASKDLLKVRDNLLNVGAKYSLKGGIAAEVRYQYQHTRNDRDNYQALDLYSTRHLINRFTQIDAAGNLTYPVPVGGIIDYSNTEQVSQTARAQLSMDRDFGLSHHVTGMAGMEVKEVKASIHTSRVYGYSEEDGATHPVNYTAAFPVNPDGNYLNIPDGNYVNALLDRYISYYASGAYTYAGRYTFSASGRIDQSNLFGVKTNQRQVPLWSAGVSWNAYREPFYRVSWLPLLRLRATYGYNGNVDKSTSAFATATTLISVLTGARSVRLVNPPNPQLRWERNGIANIGLDFQVKDNLLTGSIEYYTKKGTELIGTASIDPTTGVIGSGGLGQFRGNVAAMKGQGIDIDLMSNIFNGHFKWQVNLLYSYNTSRVTQYERTNNTIVSIINDGTVISPVLDKPVYAIFSFKWAGLDPENGNPLVYLDGKPSSDYASLFQSTSMDNLVYHGPALPTHFGAFRNNFSYKNASLSVNLTYKFGYYFRTPSISYEQLFQAGIGHADYSRRWQNPGDEQQTRVPSMPTTIQTLRDHTYANASVLVEKGDHIRLQDVVLSYQIGSGRSSLFPFQQIAVSVFANNIGILWRANKTSRDPDYISYFNLPSPRAYGVGLKCNF